MRVSQILRQILKLWIVVAVAMTSVNAQWLNYPEPGTPLTKDGKPNLVAKTPRAFNGKPDLSGVWRIEPPAPGEIDRLYGKNEVNDVVGDEIREITRHFFNLLIDFKPGEEPLTPEGRAQTLKNQQKRNLLENPSARCLPYALPNRYFHFRPFKIFQTANALAMYFDLDGAFRQIHTDGRKLPVDPLPSWMGYSTGRWEGDTLAVETAGFNDLSWLDAGGHPHSEELRVTERFHRRDFGHMDMETTVEDSKMLTKPVTIKFTLLLIPNSDVMENFCAEGERDAGTVRGAAK